MRLQNSAAESLIWKADVFRGEVQNLRDEINGLDFFKGMDWVHLRISAEQENIFSILNKLGVIWGVKNFLHLMEWRVSTDWIQESASRATFIPASSIDFEELQKLTSSLVETMSSKNFHHPVADLFYAVCPECRAYSDYYFKAAVSSDFISEVLMVNGKASGLLILKKEADLLSGIFYGISESLRGNFSMGRFILNRIKHLVSEHECLGFRSFVPVHNVPSLRVHIQEQVYPVGSYVNLMLFPLMGRVLKGGDYFKFKSTGMNQSVLKAEQQIELYESLDSGLIIGCRAASFPKLLFP